MCHSNIALSGEHTDSSNMQGRLWLGKAAPAPHTDRRDLRNLGSLEVGPIQLNMQAGVSPRSLLGIMAERTGLIAKKSPPRLSRPSASCKQVA